MLDLYWAAALFIIAFIGSIFIFMSTNKVAPYCENNFVIKYIGMVIIGVTLGLFFLWDRLSASFFLWVYQVIPYAAEQPELHQLTFWIALAFMYIGIITCLLFTPVFFGQLYDSKVAGKC